MECERRGLDGIELRSEGERRSLVGYAAVYNSLSENLGGFYEVIRPGAFTKALASGKDVLALIDHDPKKLLGRSKAGTLRLSEDARGLRYEIDPPDTSFSRDLLESVRRGDVRGASFGFKAAKDAWKKEGDKTIREIHEVSYISDVSPTVLPAYLETNVALRSLEAFLNSNWESNLATAYRKLRLRC